MGTPLIDRKDKIFIKEIPDKVKSLTGHKPSIDTVRRWIYTGLKNPRTGCRNKLRTYKFFGRRVTTRSLLIKYLEDMIDE